MLTWLGTPEFKVGVLVVGISALIGGMALKVAEGPSVLFGKRTYYFRADSAGGLIPNSAVKMAGIKVGVIDKIELENGRARIWLALESDTRVGKSGFAYLKADGILGDKHVEIDPGKPDDLDLADGSEIALQKGTGGMDDVMAEVSRVAKNLDELLSTLNHAVKTGDESSAVSRVVGNIEKLTADLREMTGQNKQKINEIIAHVQNLTRNIDTYINEESLARVDRSLRNIEDITAKLSKGEGTLGRLINDEKTVEELNSAITNVNKFLGGADKLETSFDFHSEFLTESSQTKSFLGIKIQPGLDRYYEVQVIDDPEGVKTSLERDSSNNGADSHYEETVTHKNKLKITALFAKNFYNFTIKGGLIENAGGFGMDYFLLDRAVRISAEFFNFQDAQVRAFVRYNFFKGAYITAGGDNLLGSNDENPSPFIGAGLFITNDDLKLLASKVSF